MADHELNDATGHVKDGTRLAAPQHLNLGAWLNTHGMETSAQSGVIR